MDIKQTVKLIPRIVCTYEYVLRSDKSIRLYLRVDDCLQRIMDEFNETWKEAIMAVSE
jgi:hypothetical protein